MTFRRKKTIGSFYSQRIRSVLFYISIIVFIVGLPLLLAYALGYKFDLRKLKFTKTGLLILKTQPEGADIYLDGKLLKDKTPLTINELLPGEYVFELRLKDRYPWTAKITVSPGKLSTYDKIILFPLRPDIKKLNKENVSWFYVDKEKNAIYFFDNEAGVISRSDLEGNDFELVGQILPLDSLPLNCKLSYDRKKILYFNRHKIGVCILQPTSSIILDLPKLDIRDVFWLVNNNYVILQADKAIQILELRPEAKPILLFELNKKDPSIVYDENTNTLYFYDSERLETGKTFENVYKIELKKKFLDLNLQELIKNKNE